MIGLEVRRKTVAQDSMGCWSKRRLFRFYSSRSRCERPEQNKVALGSHQPTAPLQANRSARVRREKNKASFARRAFPARIKAAGNSGNIRVPKKKKSTFSKTTQLDRTIGRILRFGADDLRFAQQRVGLRSGDGGAITGERFAVGLASRRSQG